MKTSFIILCVCSLLGSCFLFPTCRSYPPVIIKIAPMGKDNGKVGLDDSTFTTICQSSINNTFKSLLLRLDSNGYKIPDINENIIDMELTGAMIELYFDDGNVTVYLAATTRLIPGGYVAKVLTLQEYYTYIIQDIFVEQTIKKSGKYKNFSWGL